MKCGRRFLLAALTVAALFAAVPMARPALSAAGQAAGKTEIQPVATANSAVPDAHLAGPQATRFAGQAVGDAGSPPVSATAASTGALSGALAGEDALCARLDVGAALADYASAVPDAWTRFAADAVQDAGEEADALASSLGGALHALSNRIATALNDLAAALTSGLRACCEHLADAFGLG